MKLLSRLLLVLVLPVHASVAQTIHDNQAKRYPPYPEVWEYEMPLARCTKNGVSGMRGFTSAYVMGDGEIVFVTHSARPISDADSDCSDELSHHHLRYFEKRLTELSDEEVRSFEAAHRGHQVGMEAAPSLPKFENGEGISFQFTQLPIANSSLQKLDSRGNPVSTRKTILYFPMAPIKETFFPRRDETIPDPVILTMPVTDLQSVQFITLSDGTFLVYERDGTAILRLTRDFATKAQSPRLRIVETTELERIAKEVDEKVGYELEGRYEQELINAIAHELQDRP